MTNRYILREIRNFVAATEISEGIKKEWMQALTEAEAAAAGERTCTCHPDDKPPRPCPRKFAYSECVAAAGERVDAPDHTEDMMRMVRRWSEGLESDNSLRAYFKLFNQE